MDGNKRDTVPDTKKTSPEEKTRGDTKRTDDISSFGSLYSDGFFQPVRFSARPDEKPHRLDPSFEPDIKDYDTYDEFDPARTAKSIDFDTFEQPSSSLAPSSSSSTANKSTNDKTRDASQKKDTDAPPPYSPQ
jgi:hypothetical protein